MGKFDSGGTYGNYLPYELPPREGIGDWFEALLYHYHYYKFRGNHEFTTGRKVMNDTVYRGLLIVYGLALFSLDGYFITSGARFLTN